MATVKPEPRATEGELLALLERRHAKTGNGGSGEYAFMTHVRNDGGFSATRTFDAVAVALWPSRKYAMHVFEVKCSRSDWQRELVNPAKSQDAWDFGDLFSIVAPAGVVDVADLPHGWGLIEAYGGATKSGRKLRTVVKAEWHRPEGPRTIPMGAMVGMLRAVGAVPENETVSEKALREAHSAGRQEAAEHWKAQVDAERNRLKEATELMTLFGQITGRSLHPDSTTRERVEQLADSVAEYLRLGRSVDANVQRLRRLRDEMRNAAEQVNELIDSVRLPADTT